MKALSYSQALACETAREPRCRCRCGGALHGAKRNGREESPEWFAGLPPEDPHSVPLEPQWRQATFLENTDPDHSFVQPGGLSCSC